LAFLSPGRLVVSTLTYDGGLTVLAESLPTVTMASFYHEQANRRKEKNKRGRKGYTAILIKILIMRVAGKKTSDKEMFTLSSSCPSKTPSFPDMTKW
jgi:hypothetical protein